METTIYNNLLKLFVDDNEFVDWRNKPFKIGEQVMATNGHVIIIINDIVAPEIGPLTTYDPNGVLSVIPPNCTLLGTISVDDVKNLISTVPLIPVEVECETCLGEGEVEYHFESGKNYYTEDLECPVCKGEGVVKSKSGEKEINYLRRIIIGQSAFAISYLDKIVSCCEQLQVQEISIVYQVGKDSKTVFRVGLVDFLVMPVAIELNDESIIGSVSIKL